MAQVIEPLDPDSEQAKALVDRLGPTLARVRRNITERRRLAAADEEYLQRSCAASGVPVKVTDPVTVHRAADILRGDT